jgi:hypothetical protein
MKRGTKPDHPMECPCQQCYLLRVTYALQVGLNQHDITIRDMSRTLMIVTHALMMEDLEPR